MFDAAAFVSRRQYISGLLVVMAAEGNLMGDALAFCMAGCMAVMILKARRFSR